MNTMMRKTVHRGAVAMGGLALVLGAAACGGSDSSSDGSDTAAEETSAESAAEDAGEDAAAAEDSASDAGGDAAAADDTSSDDASSDDGADSAASGPLSDEDLSAASKTFIDFMGKAADGDGKGACALMVDPTTGEAVSGTTLDACGSSLESQLGDSIDQETAALFTEENVKAVDNGDGTAKIPFMDNDIPGFTVVKSPSGDWLIDAGVSAG